jgi:hypothetical protein
MCSLSGENGEIPFAILRSTAKDISKNGIPPAKAKNTQKDIKDFVKAFDSKRQNKIKQE